MANGYTTGDQVEPAVCVVGDDDFMVIWSGRNPGAGFGESIGAQRFSRAGKRKGAQFVVTSYATAGYRSAIKPAIASAADGSFVVAWASYGPGEGSDIAVQRFDHTGALADRPIPVNTLSSGDQTGPTIGVDGPGNFVVAWTDFGTPDDSRTDARMRAFDTLGNATTEDTLVSPGQTGVSNDAAIAGYPGGGFVVVWDQTDRDGDSFGIFGKRLSPDGVGIGTEFQLNTYTTSAQRRPAVAAVSDDGFVAVWQSYRQEGSGYQAIGRAFDANGSPRGSEFRVNAYTTNHQTSPRISMDATGAFAVAWESYDVLSGGPNGQDGDGRGIFGRAFDSTGSPIGSEFQVNTTTEGNQGDSRLPELDIAMYADGDFVAVWYMPDDGFNNGIGAQRFHLDRDLGPVCGDAVRNDLRVSVSDALAVLQASIGVGGCEDCVCDVDNSGSVVASDAQRVLQHVVGLESPLTCPPCQ